MDAGAGRVEPFADDHLVLHLTQDVTTALDGQLPRKRLSPSAVMYWSDSSAPSESSTGTINRPSGASRAPWACTCLRSK